MTGVVRARAAALVAALAAVALTAMTRGPPGDREAILILCAAGAARRDPRQRKRGRRENARDKRCPHRRAGAREADATDHLAARDTVAVARQNVIAGAYDQHGLQQAHALELSHGVSNLSVAHRLTEAILGHPGDLADRGTAVAAVKDGRSQRLEAVRLLGARVIDHGLAADPLDQKPLRSRRRNRARRLPGPHQTPSELRTRR